MVKIMTCPSCNSEKVKIKREKTGEVSGRYSKKHSVTWWLCIGWWLIMLDICTFGIFHSVFWGKKKANGRASLWHTVAICQNCGHTWETAEK